MKELVLSIAKRTGLFLLASWVTRNKVRIIGYHGIWFLGGHFGNHLFISPAKLRARLNWLKQSKYAVLSLDEAIEGLRTHNSTAYSTVITIDDGWYGTYSHMLPMLEQLGLPATLYVYTGAVESQKPLANVLIPAAIHLSKQPRLRIQGVRSLPSIDLDIGDERGKSRAASQMMDILRGLPPGQAELFCREVVTRLGHDYDRIIASRQFSFMTFDEIADASVRGLDIQLHTHSHSLSLDEPEQLDRQITENRKRLKRYTASSLQHFCYPNGTHSKEMQKYLERQSIKSATLVDVGLVSVDDNPYELKRILDGEDISPLEFEAELSGFLEIARGVSRFVANGKVANHRVVRLIRMATAHR